MRVDGRARVAVLVGGAARWVVSRIPRSILALSIRLSYLSSQRAEPPADRLGAAARDVGGKTKCGGRGRTRKVLVVASVEVRLLDKPRRNGNRKFYAGRLRLGRTQ